jgi:hypothetical protein
VVIWLPIAEIPVPNQRRRNCFDRRSGVVSTAKRANSPRRPGRSASPAASSIGAGGSI